MFGRIRVTDPAARRLIGSIAVPCREASFLTHFYELRKFDHRAFAAETEVGEAPDEKVISYADQIDELMKIHLCHLQGARPAGENHLWFQPPSRDFFPVS
ncbi:MAG: hypothetical protein ACREOI_21315 [bacterium]